MEELLSAAQMRHAESEGIASGQVTGLQLMEQAGQGVVDAILERWPEYTAGSRRVVVICGPGNNGGDGYVIARLLSHLGWEVEVYCDGKPSSKSPDAQRNRARWCEMGPAFALADVSHSRLLEPPRADSPTLLVDAGFGTGLSRPISAQWAQVFSHLSTGELSQGMRIVAVDLPSGLCSDSGRVLGAALPAELTVTFHRAKMGHYLCDGPALCGCLDVRPIGLDRRSVALQDKAAKLVTYPATTGVFDKPSASAQSNGAGVIGSQHKFDHGHALVCSGPASKTGAARLTARGALRIGAGLVTIASPRDALQENGAHLTAVMLKPCDTADDIRKLLADDRISSVCLGPGFSRVLKDGTPNPEHTGQFVKAVLKAQRKTVLDADALSAFSDDPQELFTHLHNSCVLTPHEGEFKRLFPDIHEILTQPPSKGPAYSKIDATRRAAARAGCVILFKGADTVIADPDGRTAVHAARYERSAPWLATAGSGDVLAGFICGLLARGRNVFDAAQQAAWLHTECARYFGPGLIAEDLPEIVPEVLRRLGK
ncbi:bifunctional ADP-dependent NAD(P)H-hydrate dehydratase/NAD(P)H-hydrate epimerase [Neptunicoccus sediminis]|uniref:bifunctional ADP-dependent NAD(P)H-hydrate dehydratase/NAD(P)H-hydrate epimerase n=1 Tax=Neptunicoccus sediminis TaxID=1892596 RepID=UPI0008460B65|nr:bifunctional ADP-dependent NAD(P)H-hydrate dehydratase/NAD(P)H-hydrate epimerase [Neptunicoccus sediminis]